MPRTKRHSPLHGPPIEATDRGERSRQALARARQITGVVNGETPFGWRRVYTRYLGRYILIPDDTTITDPGLSCATSDCCGTTG
jgi:hypothetical protein